MVHPGGVFHRILGLISLTISKLWPRSSPKVRAGLLEINAFLSSHKKEVRVSLGEFVFPLPERRRFGQL